MDNKLLEYKNIIEKSSDKIIADSKSLKYVDPNTIKVENKFYTVVTEEVKNYLSRIYGLPSRAFSDKLWKFYPKAWSEIIESATLTPDNKEDFKYLILKDDTVVATRIEETSVISDIIDLLDRKNELSVTVLKSDEISLNLLIQGVSDKIITIEYDISSDYVVIREGVLYENNGTEIIVTTKIYSSYVNEESKSSFDYMFKYLEDSEVDDYLYEITISSIEYLFDKKSSYSEIKRYLLDSSDLSSYNDLLDYLSDSKSKDNLSLFLANDFYLMPSNELKRSATFSDNITYYDILVILNELIIKGVVPYRYYLEYFNLLVKSKTNENYMTE